MELLLRLAIALSEPLLEFLIDDAQAKEGQELDGDAKTRFRSILALFSSCRVFATAAKVLPFMNIGACAFAAKWHRPCSVNTLIVGDGNMTFSLALARLGANLTHSSIMRSIMWCTTFDEEEALLRKYPETRSALRKLRMLQSSKCSINIAHGVNAANLCAKSFLGKDGAEVSFHSIIFNHPHLGIEDAERNGALLSHFSIARFNCFSQRKLICMCHLFRDKLNDGR